jgi:hypothetical protein
MPWFAVVAANATAVPEPCCRSAITWFHVWGHLCKGTASRAREGPRRILGKTGSGSVNYQAPCRCGDPTWLVLGTDFCPYERRTEEPLLACRTRPRRHLVASTIEEFACHEVQVVEGTVLAGVPGGDNVGDDLFGGFAVLGHDRELVRSLEVVLRRQCAMLQ